MEVLADPNQHDETMRELYEASLSGSVSTLNTLIQRDPLILNRVSLYPFTETPLHVASLQGHVAFCEALLDANPSLAAEANAQGRRALHLAAANGHTDAVKALVLRNPESCAAGDRDGKIPLHFAAMRGRLGAIEELIGARPDSVEESVDESGDGSVLHVCVRYNQLEALKLMVESVRGDDGLLCGVDREGDTVLHLAVRRRQIQTIEYLLSLAEMSTREAINALNRAGLTALDMLEPDPTGDPISTHTIQQILTAAGAHSSSSANTVTVMNGQHGAPSTNTDPNAQQPPPPSPSTQSLQESQQQHGCCRWDKIEIFCKTYLLNQENWIEKIYEQLIVAATVIATMTFAAVLSPPGGVWSQDTLTGNYDCPTYGFCEAGTAVVGYAWSPDYLKFIFFNSASFFSSLCVVLVIISGLPLENRVIMWILAFFMIVSVTCMLLTYMWALGLVSPNHIYYRIRNLGYILVGTWAFLLLLICLIQITRFFFWARSWRKSFRTAQATENRAPPSSDAART